MSLLNGRTYHSKPLCLTLPSDIFTLIKLKWEGLSMYFSFCYMFMGRYISLTKGKLYPGLVILCNVSFEGQLKQRQVPKCSWYFMHSAKRLSHPCPAPLEVISCQFFFFVFFFSKSFCAHKISKIKHHRGTFLPDCFSFSDGSCQPLVNRQGEIKRAFPPKISIKIKSSGMEKMSMWAKQNSCVIRVTLRWWVSVVTYILRWVALSCRSNFPFSSLEFIWAQSKVKSEIWRGVLVSVSLKMLGTKKKKWWLKIVRRLEFQMLFSNKPARLTVSCSTVIL